MVIQAGNGRQCSQSSWEEAWETFVLKGFKGGSLGDIFGEDPNRVFISFMLMLTK